MLPFVGVDGEGGNVPDEYGFTSHQYTMLGVGDRYCTDRWFDFLANLPKRQIYVSYFFDYDVTMMCRHLPEHLLRVLVSGQTVQYGNFGLHYRPRKEFGVRAYGRHVIINDTGTFFQSKFATALRRWNIGTSAELDIIDDGKEGRKDFGPLTPQIIEYNRLEMRLLAELMEKFRRTCITIGYMPRQWQGPGQLAKAMLRKHEVPMTKDLPEPNLAGVWDAAQAAYYGGRFETSVVGPVKQPVDGWDINSAYPAAITSLPCLRHTQWSPSKTVTTDGIFRIQYTHHRKQRWYGLPHRTYNGRIIYPRSGAGWYWGCEILAAEKLGLTYEVRHGFTYVQNCEHRLFDFVPRLYSVRKAIGKSEAGIALKLALNSLYGVFAQSVGDPPYSNPVYAGLITAMTRAKLIDVLAHDPESVYMLATDGIFCTPGLPLEKSDALGGWDHKHYPDGMHIVMPGVYFADGSRESVVKTRGVSGSVVKKNRDRLIGAYKGNRGDHVTVSLRQFIPLRMALARNRPELAGHWMEVDRAIGYDWSTKRHPDILIPDMIGDRTEPYDYADEPESTPYGKAIGGNLLRGMDRLEFTDQPEWADTLVELP